MATLSFTIRKTDGREEYKDVEALTLPTQDGFVEILPGHADYIAETASGVCAIKLKEGNTEVQLPTPGLVRVHGDRVMLLL